MATPGQPTSYKPEYCELAAARRRRVQERLHGIGPHDQRAATLALERAFAFQAPHRFAHRRA